MHRRFRNSVLVLCIALVLVCARLEAAAERPEGEGFVTSVEELARLGEQARRGSQPLRKHFDMVVSVADEPWPYGIVGTRFETFRTGEGTYEKHCVKVSDTSVRRLLPEAGSLIYAKALAYNLTGDEKYARAARSVLLNFARSTGYNKVDGLLDYTGANQCALDLSLFLPIMIDSAILLESWPGWTPADKLALQQWLSDVPYKTAAAIARTRKNNWGTTAAFAGWAIGHYLLDSGLMLDETHPERRRLTPEQARASHLRSQLNMIGNTWEGDSRCRIHGIQENGGIPNELRRGSTGCEGQHLRTTDSSYDYQIMTLSHLVYHAEAVRRHMDDELFDHGGSSGSASILRAIKFVIDNSDNGSQDWKLSDLGVLRIASHAYRDGAICRQLQRSNPNHVREGLYIPFTKLTRPEDNC